MIHAPSSLFFLIAIPISSSIQPDTSTRKWDVKLLQYIIFLCAFLNVGELLGSIPYRSSLFASLQFFLQIIFYYLHLILGFLLQNGK